MIILILGVLGICLGSFVNAFVWRLHQQSLPSKKQKHNPSDLSISKGRSMCVNCGHTLGAKDLVPVLSWLSLKGKCRYCKKPISWQYPLVELSTAILFIISYIFWPHQFTGAEIGVFGLWLVSLLAFMSLIVYDLRWMLLPNKIVFPMYGVAVIFVGLRIIAEQSWHPLVAGLLGAAIGGGIFYVLFQFSKGSWIGGGDVKLGFFLGALIGGPLNAFLLLFLASLLGTLISVPLIMLGRAQKQTRIPFGPFLIIAAIIIQLFGADIVDAYMAFLGIETQ